MTPWLVLAIAVAGALGATARFGVTHLFVRRPPRLPWAVFIVNVVGSLLGGVVIGLSQSGLLAHEWRLILLTGVAGGLTTFSTFSVETIQLVHTGRWRAAVLSVAANLVAGVAAVVLGCCLVLALAG